MKPVREIRSVYLSPAVAVQVDPKKSKHKVEQIAGVTAKLNRFVTGRPVTVATPDNGGKKGDIKALKEKSGKIFEFRFFDVAPQLRILGIFPQKDVFLACQMYERGKLEGAWGKEMSRVAKQISAMGKDAPAGLSYTNMDLVLSNWTESI